MENVVFHPIDLETWERRDHFEYYTNTLKTSFNLSADIEITEFVKWQKKAGFRFYPSFIYVVMTAINRNREFRMAWRDGVLGFYEMLHPNFTIFHDDDKTFSDIWTWYDPDFNTFYESCIADMETYKDKKGVKVKGGTPPAFCPVSCIPWLSFRSLAHDTTGPSKMYFPVIVFGKYYEENGKIKIPFSIHCNHAAADGYHAAKLFQDIHDIAESMAENR